ncbi:MAG: exonuclease [Chloroflexi bacterium]|nr:MAG: exonuclease [Chloroflexota bacterium]
MNDVCVALDVEATGMDPTRDEVIEIGAVKFRGNTVVARFASLVRPSSTISLGIRSLTGISNEQARSAPPFMAIAPKLRDFVRQFPIVGQSIEFDLEMLAAAGLRFENVRYDTFELATILLPELPAYNLLTIASKLGIDTAGTHRAVTDAETTMAVFNRLVERTEDFDDATLRRIAEATRVSGSQLTHLFSQLVRERQAEAGGTIGTSIGAQLLAQLSRAPEAGSEAMFLIPRERPAKLEPTGSQAPIAAETLREAMAADGAFAGAISGFEERPQQLAMMEAAAETFNWGGQLLVEAGTGTGKSLGYLLPAALHAVEKGDRVVVSTATIALQDQLLRKDVPALINAARAVQPTGALAPVASLRDLKVALLKGRTNYLCLRRWFLAQRDELTSPAQAQLHAKVIAWLQQTETGDSAELHLAPEQHTHWRRLSAEEGACVPAQCMFHRRNQCFLFRARHEAEAAHVVVVNHALLLSDLLTGHTVVPTYRQLVIDEAHHLESEATDQIGYAITRMQGIELTQRVLHEQEPIGMSGAVGMAFRALAGIRDERTKSATARIQDILPDVTASIERCRSGLERLFASLAEFTSRQEANNGGYERQLRLTDTIRSNPGWTQFEIEWDDLLQLFATLVEALRVVSRAIEQVREDDLPTRAELLTECELLERDLDAYRQRMTGFISQPSADAIYWVAVHANTGEASCHAAPLHVGEVLNDRLFHRCESVLLTSATLTTEGSFDYIRDRLGLEGADELRVPSPFNFREAALLAVVNDIPPPGEQGHQKRIQDAIVELVRASQGRAMVLFTSHSALQATHRAIKRPLEQAGIVVLGQRIDGSPRQLIERIKAHPTTVLLGTNSFWEGVDIVGDTLSLLVITKLPFPVPSDPVFAARSELFDDPFNQYAVPQAILRFKQGFGRLIRSAEDRGACVVLDRRISSRRYGEAFVSSLPDCRTIAGSSTDIAYAVGQFLANSRPPVPSEISLIAEA